MLYDPKWEQQTEQRADPLSKEALIAWLEKQDPTLEYCYSDAGHCLAAQYNQSIGREYEVVELLDDDNDFDWHLEDIACQRPRTFGAALKRARSRSFD